MQDTGVRPNSVTLLSLLLACTHSGLGDKGYTYFNKARVEDPGLLTPEHYACMVDLLSRAGRWQSVSMIRKEEFRVAVGLKSEASFISLLQGTETMNNTIRFIRSWDFCLPTFEFEGESVILWVKRI